MNTIIFIIVGNNIEYQYYLRLDIPCQEDDIILFIELLTNLNFFFYRAFSPITILSRRDELHLSEHRTNRS